MNEKLSLKVHPWSWKFKKKWDLSHMEKRSQEISVYILNYAWVRIIRIEILSTHPLYPRKYLSADLKHSSRCRVSFTASIFLFPAVFQFWFPLAAYVVVVNFTYWFYLFNSMGLFFLIDTWVNVQLVNKQRQKHSSRQDFSSLCQSRVRYGMILH